MVRDDNGDDEPGQRVPDAPLATAYDVFVGRDDNHKDEQNRHRIPLMTWARHHDAKEACLESEQPAQR